MYSPYLTAGTATALRIARQTIIQEHNDAVETVCEELDAQIDQLSTEVDELRARVEELTAENQRLRGEA